MLQVLTLLYARCVAHSTPTSIVVKSPRANSSYEGKRLEVRVEYSGPVDERSSKLYFEYTGDPNISSILPRQQLATSVNDISLFHE